MKAKKTLLRKSNRLIILIVVALVLLTWVLYKNSDPLTTKSVINSISSSTPILSNQKLSPSVSVNTVTWNEHYSEWSTNISGISGEDPSVTHYLVFEIYSKLPNSWAIGDNSFFYNNDQSTWVQEKGQRIMNPGSVPSQLVEIERLTISDKLNTYQISDNKFTQISHDGLVALVSKGLNNKVETEIIKSLRIKLKSSKCLNTQSSSGYYDCPAPTNVSFEGNR